jgi:thiamine pyrophosphate-dependent acetolactate synthase large subunit-like protein
MPFPSGPVRVEGGVMHARSCRCPTSSGSAWSQAYHSIGLGLATTIGAALAGPDRVAVAAIGDGGGLTGVSEMETVTRPFGAAAYL